MTWISYMPARFTYLLGLVIVSLLLLSSLYLQFFDGFTPCPLCILQRIAFCFLGILFLGGIFLHSHFWGRLSINMLTIFTSLAGIIFSGRQIWLQHFPPQDPSECGVSLQYMMQVLPMNQVITKIFAGSAECTQRGWEFLSLSMAEWTLVWFILFFLFSCILLFKECFKCSDVKK
ncbi:MAG: disulfide bond formation protein B [Gammaproteobacteria bacterium]|nr:disulfide bond formation protein B [Gammaproteobacteria bacterium]